MLQRLKYFFNKFENDIIMTFNDAFLRAAIVPLRIIYSALLLVLIRAYSDSINFLNNQKLLSFSILVNIHKSKNTIEMWSRNTRSSFEKKTEFVVCWSAYIPFEMQTRF